MVICLRNEGYVASLELRKLYVRLPDAAAARLGQARIIDESGEDYLYPADWFGEVELSPALRKAVLAAV